jgi:DNA-binding SARP family transcriptional activator/ABC-type branched-subunit amino acid transport system substrate-binding protein/streptogramin lyase
MGGRVLPLGGAKQRAVLAILLLHANEVVSSDRLIDELWGGLPPETAPTSLHGYVSQLRKRLEPTRAAGEESRFLVTRPPGYLLRVDPEQLDLHRFEQLAARARRDLVEGKPDSASATLREALDLWRGPPLADLAVEPFAQAEVARLDELRLAALEERFDADLALGRHHELVPEIEGLIRRHPLRERLRGQLILALYRAGRQADALEAHQQTRRVLVEQLGIEPGQALQRLERRILLQDSSLELPPGAEGPVERASLSGPAVPPVVEGQPDKVTWLLPSSRRRRAIGVLVGLLAAAAAAAFALKVTQDDGSVAAPTGVSGNSLALVDAESNDLVEQIPVGNHPTSVAAGEGAVWVLNADDQTISRIDEESRQVKTFAIGETPHELAVGAGAVWVGVRGGAAVSRLDPQSGVVDRMIPVFKRGHDVGSSGVTSGGTAIAVDDGAVWVVKPDRTVSRIDPQTNRVVATVRSGRANTLAVGERAVWVVNIDSSVSQIDPTTNEVRATIEVPSNSLTGAVVGAGSLWATDPIGGAVWRVDPHGSRLIMRTITVEFGAAGIAFGKGTVWVSNGVQGTLTRIDPQTNRVTETIALGSPPQSLAIGADGVWVTTGGSRAAGGTGEALPQPPCGSVFYEGPGEPRFLIGSDLPLQGGSRANTLSIIEAIQLVLRARSFKAGKHSVGYQFCDDATAQAGGFEYEKCASNASAYVAHRRVLGVIGAYNSDCSFIQIAITNRASLAMISPSNSAIGLTRASPSSARGQLPRLYPTGKRNYVRIYPADDIQAAANAIFARQLGCKAIFVLDDGEGGYALDMTESFVRSAGRIRLPVAGGRRWDPGAASYQGLARAIARARADCVFIAGQIYSNGGRLLRDLRASLGPDVPILASDGFARVEDVVEIAGGAAHGLYVSVPGVPAERLGPAGEQFLRRLRSTRPAGAKPNLYWGAYGAQAAELLLDAIALSDGTRSSVTRQLLASRAKNGILGDIRFDQSGDVMPSAITILRVARGGEGMSRAATDFADGAVVERVITPPTHLVR